MGTESVSAPVALVTCADKGIRLETVRRLAGTGCRVYLSARRSERGGAAAATAGARFVGLDVTSDKSVYQAVGCIEQSEGYLDVRDPHEITAAASPKRSRFSPAAKAA
jgi:NAD(P)-dependent dehydrogenase (short-subunit alcohol dehydrogenase family)